MNLSKTDRQTCRDKQTDRHADRQTDTQRHSRRPTDRGTQTDGQTEMSKPMTFWTTAEPTRPSGRKKCLFSKMIWAKLITSAAVGGGLRPLEILTLYSWTLILPRLLPSTARPVNPSPWKPSIVLILYCHSNQCMHIPYCSTCAITIHSLLSTICAHASDPAMWKIYLRDVHHKLLESPWWWNKNKHRLGLAIWAHLRIVIYTCRTGVILSIGHMFGLPWAEAFIYST